MAAYFLIRAGQIVTQWCLINPFSASLVLDYIPTSPLSSTDASCDSCCAVEREKQAGEACKAGPFGLGLHQSKSLCEMRHL